MKACVYNGEEFRSVKSLADKLGTIPSTLTTRMNRSLVVTDGVMSKVKYNIFGEGFNSVKVILRAYGLGDICVSTKLSTNTDVLRYIGFSGRLPYLVKYNRKSYDSIIELSKVTGMPVSLIFRCMVVQQLTLEEAFDVFYCETKSHLAKGPFKTKSNTFKNVLDLSEFYNIPYAKIYKDLRDNNIKVVIKKLRRRPEKDSEIIKSHLIYHDFYVHGTLYKNIKDFASKIHSTPGKVYRLLYNHNLSFEQIYDYITQNPSGEVE